MTVVDLIKKKVDVLPPEQQQEVLNFVDFLKANSRKSRSAVQSGKVAARKQAVHGKGPENRIFPKTRKPVNKAEALAALRGIAGIWKDRTDLPRDPVEAVKFLRKRMTSRGRNA